jgi:hypothetical protein
MCPVERFSLLPAHEEPMLRCASRDIASSLDGVHPPIVLAAHLTEGEATTLAAVHLCIVGRIGYEPVLRRIERLNRHVAVSCPDHRARRLTLIVVTSKDEIVRTLSPFPDQRQLHPVEVLRLVRKDHRRVLGRDGNIGETTLDQIGEVKEAQIQLVPRPLFLELA